MSSLKKWEQDEHWVEIDLDLCVGAAECVEVCPVDVYSLIDGKVSADNIGECIECMACLDACPTYAILNHSAW
ncbi:MAG: ferredoxin family protein [Promethearchaeota archaeon]|nr:MAG: ferredoxin family protein [Candidatus Lokiarchaeota archaeon]